MTNEELIDFIKSSKGHWTFKTESGKEVSEEQIIKALEQQPSEDCISREQAIRATYGFERYTGIDEAPYEYTESVLRDLPPVTPQQTKWISCFDRLPEDYIHVLCQFTLGGMGECYLAHGVFHVVGGVVMTCNEVIAWQPLPQRYEVESEDEE